MAIKVYEKGKKVQLSKNFTQLNTCNNLETILAKP